MSKQTIIFYSLIIIALAIFTIQIKPFSQAKQTEHISIAVSKTPLSAPFYIAQKLNYFEENSLNVDIIEVIGGKKSFQSVMNKQANYGTSSDSVLMFGGLNGEQYANISSFVESDNDIKLILNIEDNSSINELKGKKVGVTKGSASEYFLSLLLEINQLKITDVELVQLAPNKMLEALLSHKVSAVATWEPYAYKIKKELGERIKIVDTKNLYTLSFNLIAEKNYALKHHETNKRLLQSLQQAILFINTKPKQAKNILLESLNLKKDFIDWVWADYIYSLSLNSSLILTIEDEARWAIQSGLSSSKIPNYKNNIDSRALHELDSHAVSFKSNPSYY